MKQKKMLIIMYLILIALTLNFMGYVYVSESNKVENDTRELTRNQEQLEIDYEILIQRIEELEEELRNFKNDIEQGD